MENDNLGAKLHSTTDADVWAKEFMTTFKNHSGKSAWIDEDTIRTWFANSIMCGWNHAHQKLDKKHSQILNFCAGLISTTDQFKNTHPMDVRDWILKQIQEMNDKDAEYEREFREAKQPLQP